MSMRFIHYMRYFAYSSDADGEISFVLAQIGVGVETKIKEEFVEEDMQTGDANVPSVSDTPSKPKIGKRVHVSENSVSYDAENVVISNNTENVQADKPKGKKAKKGANLEKAFD